MAERVFTFEEVAKHNKKGDCWIIISGKVYDVSSFLEEHPGGDEIILNSTEKDATMDYVDVNHSIDAMSKKEEFLIGHIDKYTLPDTHHRSPPPDASPSNLLYVLALVIMGVAFLLQFYSKQEEA